MLKTCLVKIHHPRFLLLCAALIFSIHLLGRILFSHDFQQFAFDHAVFEEYDYQTCIVSRVKDVSLLLPQFFEYHIAAGIDHFFLTNHCSRSETLFWTDFYRKEVTMFRNQSFNDCCAGGTTDEAKLIDFTFQLAKPRCKWIVVMDFDEYIFPTRAVDGARIPDYLSEMTSLQLLRMPWLLMSNNGLEIAPRNKTFIEIFQRGSFNRIKKTMVRSAYVTSWHSPHQPEKFLWSSIIKTPRGQLLRDYSRPFYISSNEMFQSEQSTAACEFPRAPLYIRHYQSIAWDDTKTLRANRQHVWRFGSNEKELRDIWQQANHSIDNTICLLTNNGGWTGLMIHEMLESSLNRLKAYRLQQPSNESTLERDYARWLRGVPLT